MAAPTGIISIKCDICGKEFGNTRNLTVHKVIHNETKDFKCDVCAKAFVRMSYLRIHMTTHTGRKDYKCEHCDKAFSNFGNWSRHVAIHTGVKDFKCDICAKAFGRESYLTAHMTTHTGRKDFKCDMCDKAFGDLRNLRRHQNTHTGLKNFKCEICHKSFGQKSSLITHEATHTGAKDFKCEVCNKGFRQKNHLDKHKAVVHTGIKDFKCTCCDKSFSNKRGLARHMIAHSKDFKRDRKGSGRKAGQSSLPKQVATSTRTDQSEPSSSTLPKGEDFKRDKKGSGRKAGQSSIPKHVIASTQTDQSEPSSSTLPVGLTEIKIEECIEVRVKEEPQYNEGLDQELGFCYRGEDLLGMAQNEALDGPSSLSKSMPAFPQTVYSDFSEPSRPRATSAVHISLYEVKTEEYVNVRVKEEVLGQEQGLGVAFGDRGKGLSGMAQNYALAGPSAKYTPALTQTVYADQCYDISEPSTSALHIGLHDIKTEDYGKVRVKEEPECDEVFDQEDKFGAVLETTIKVEVPDETMDD